MVNPLDTLRQSVSAKIQKKAQDLYGGAANFIQNAPAPSMYFGAKAYNAFQEAANTAGQYVQQRTTPTISPVQLPPLENARRYAIEQGGKFAGAILPEIPKIVRGAVFATPPGMVGQGLQYGNKGVPVEEKLNAGYRALQAATPFLPAQAALGAAIGTGMSVVGNLLQGNPAGKDLGASAAEGVLSTGPNILAMKAGQALLPRLYPQGDALKYNQAISKAKNVRTIAADIVRRSMQAGLANAGEGAAIGGLRPLREGESRQQAIAKDAVTSAIMGLAIQGGADLTKMSSVEIAKRLDIPLAGVKAEMRRLNNVIQVKLPNGKIKQMRRWQWMLQDQRGFVNFDEILSSGTPKANRAGSPIPQVPETQANTSSSKIKLKTKTSEGPSATRQSQELGTANERVASLPTSVTQKIMVGTTVRAKDRGNIGVIVRINENGTAKVSFRNKIDGTHAFVDKDVNLLDPIRQPTEPSLMGRTPSPQEIVYNSQSNQLPRQPVQKQRGRVMPSLQKTLLSATKEAKIGVQPNSLSPETQKMTRGLDSSGNIITQGRPDQTINTSRLGLTESEKKNVLELDTEDVRRVLSNDEIRRVAKSAGFDTKTYGEEETAKMIAKQLNMRRRVVELEKQRSTMLAQGADEVDLAKITRDIAQTARAARMQGTQVGRELQARKIMADEISTPMQKVFQLLDAAGVNPEKYEADATKVDFNNPQQVIEFYRKFVPPSWGEVIDLVRYNSMLSSPNTWINNAFSNAVNTSIVAPIEKTLTGTLDFIAAPFRKGQRKQFAMEGPIYAKGYVENLGRATSKLAQVLRGKTISTNLDVREIPLVTGGPLKRAYDSLAFPTRVLEGADQFFKTLTEGGERAALKYRASKGVSVGDVESQAEANATYRLFRQKLKDERQGVLLNGIDELTAAIQKVRASKNWIASGVAKFTLPFIQTPMNIFKQGVEYSPAGFATIPGAQNKTEQLSKAILGSSAAAATYLMFESGRITWAEPVSEKQRAAFRAAGMQPYSVKIGDNWVSFQKLPPTFSFPMAVVAALGDARKNKLITDDELDVYLKAFAKYANFFADQTYVKQIGAAVDTAKGDPEGMIRLAGNYAQQFVPYRAMLGWLARLADPYQRKVDKDVGILEQQLQNLMTQIPFVSMQVPARLDQFGNPIPNNNKEINALSPVRITKENPEAKQIYEFMQEKSMIDKNKKALKEKIQQEVASGMEVQAAETVENLPSITDQQAKMKAEIDEARAKALVETKGNIAQTDTKVFYLNENGNVASIDKPKAIPLPVMTGQAELDKKLITQYKSRLSNQENDIVKLFELGVVTKEQAEKLINDFREKSKKIHAPAVGGSRRAKIKVPQMRPQGGIRAPKAAKIKLYKAKRVKLKRLRSI